MPAEIHPATRMPPWRTRIFVLAALLAATALLRAPSLWRSVLDWDESLYALMAAAWRMGHLPYSTIWDNKPVGIYAIFAGFQIIFGPGVIAIRIATILFASLTAFATFCIAFALLAPPRRTATAGLAAMAYLIGALSNDGLAANTEMFMVCFTSLAMLAALSGAAPARRGGLAGFLFAGAVLTKYVAIFEAPALVFALLLWAEPASRAGVIRLAAGAVIGGALPLLLLLSLYASHGQLGLLWQDSVVSNFTRVGTPFTTAAAIAALHIQLLRWLPYYLAPLVLLGLGLNAALPRKTVILLLLWLAGGSLGVAAAKSFYDHYFQQILPALCVITALVFEQIRNARLRLGAFALFIALPAIAAASALWQITWPVLTISPGHIAWHPDVPAQIAADLNAARQPGQRIYVFDDQPVIYSLTNASPPTRFVLPSTLTTCFLARVAGVDAPAEVARILATNPSFIIASRFPAADTPNKNQLVYAMVHAALNARYQPWKYYDTSTVYRLVHPQAGIAASTAPGCAALP